jgi:hypothetical protein
MAPGELVLNSGGLDVQRQTAISENGGPGPDFAIHVTRAAARLWY